jgi:hypothetical protein
MNENEIKNALTQIGNDLRQAERLMFSGKTEEAMQIITKTGGLIEQVKPAEPQNTQIKSSEAKYLKLKSDIEKRLHKPLTAGGAPAPIAVGAGSAKPVQLPYDARKPMQDMQNCLRVADRNLQDLVNAPVDQKESLMKRIDENIKGAKDYLESAKSEAARKGVSDHPDFEEGTKIITEAEARFATTKSGALSAISAASEKSAQVDADIAGLKAEYERLGEIFNQASVPYYNDLEPMRKMLNVIEGFEKNERANLQKRLDDFSSKYGATRDEIDDKARSGGYSGNDRPSYPFEALTDGLKKTGEARRLAAEDLVKKLNEMMLKLPEMHDFSRETMYGTLKEWIGLAARFDSDNSIALSAKEAVDRAISEDKKKLEAKIDAKDWPGNTKGGEADAALAFFKNDKDWGARPKGSGPEDQPRIPLGVSIHGGWSVQATDILGKPIQYGLPAFVAVQIEREQPMKRVRIYDVTLRTKEGPNVEPKPPFESITVGNSFYIRPDKIK